TTRASRNDSRCSAPVFSMGCLLPGGLVVVHLVQDAAALGGERTVLYPRRPAGVRRGERLLAAASLGVVADDEVAMHDVHLFPVVVHERLGRISAGLDLEEPGAAAALILLVEVGAEDLLVEARRIARRAFPAAVEIDFDEFQMLLRLHDCLLHASTLCIAWCVTVPSNGGKPWKSSRACARSCERNACAIASGESNSSCARRTVLPRFTGKGSLHCAAVWSTTRFIPGQRARIGTWCSRDCVLQR